MISEQGLDRILGEKGVIAFVSEIHGNIEALEAVSAVIQSYDNLERIVCLGDIVGYGASPNEVVELFRELEQTHTIDYCMGNHDAGALGICKFVDLSNEEDLARLREAFGVETLPQIVRALKEQSPKRFSPVKKLAKDSVDWTSKALTQKNKDFLLERLKESIKLDEETLCVHASPREPIFEYVRDPKFALYAFESTNMNGISVCFIGHTHIPVLWRLRREDRMSFAGSVVVLSKPERIVPRTEPLVLETEEFVYLVNAGSVGQPRDGIPRACFVLYDREAHSLEYVRIPYDIERACHKIISAGLPAELAQRLGMADAEAGVIQPDD